jgi:hypothetical protein
MTIAPSKPFRSPSPPPQHCATPLSTTLHYPRFKLKRLKEMTNVFIFGKISPIFDLKNVIFTMETMAQFIIFEKENSNCHIFIISFSR